MRRKRRIAAALCLAVVGAVSGAGVVRAGTPVVVQNEAGFEGLEEPSIIYFPGTNTFQTDPTNFKNHVDEGGGMFRDTLRNNYAALGWWDGDGADTANTDRQRSEPKGIVGLGHQQVEQTFEYSFDFRTDSTFQATSNFDHIFQLKATNGDDGSPLATISLYKSGSGIQGRVDSFSDGDGTTGNTETVPTTFSYTAGQWIHFVIRITPVAVGETTGGIQLSVNGGAFTGVTNAAIDLTGSTDFRPKFGFYRGISTTNGVPAGDSWVEHRTITGVNGSSNVLSWKGGLNNNTWDTASTANFLNGANASAFNTIDQVNFTGSANTTINIAGNVWPDFADVNSSSNFTFQGTGAITGGTLKKEGTGTLTLATTNTYPGLTDVRAGTLFVTGSIGSNSLASVTGGTLKLGSATALGTGTVNGTQIAGGMLDLNGFGIGVEPVTVQGTGVGGAGAIVNTGGNQTTAVTSLTLTGDTTFGGTGRWDVRGTGAQLSTGNAAFNLTKTGTNQISFVGANVDAALGNITINQGILAFQTSATSLGDPTKNVTIAAAGTLDFFNSTGNLNKKATFNGGTMWAESGTGSQNTYIGSVTLNAGGGVFDAGGNLTGGSQNANAVLTVSGAVGGVGALTKNGPGMLTLSNALNNYAGGTTVNAGTLVAGSVSALGTGGLTVHTGGTAKLASGLLAQVRVPTAKLDGVTGNWAGSVDITNDKLVIETTANHATAVFNAKDQVAFAAANGNGAGIFSSTMLSGQQVVVVDNAVAGLVGFGGFVDSNSILVTATWAGDTDLSGAVDILDLQTLANHWQQPATDWSQGDFDANGVVDIRDLQALANHWQAGANGGGGSGSGDSLSLSGLFNGDSTPTPEPGTMSVMALSGVLLMRRRK